MRSLWSSTEGRQCISQFMSRVRFELLTKYLRFDLTSTRQRRRQVSKFAPMGSVFDLWEQQLSRPFIPYEYVTVDETLVPFRGRCSFKQYMPSKPAKYGLKFWCLCDANTAYCLRMQPYLGTDHGAVRTTNLGKKVCYQGILSGPLKATAGPGKHSCRIPKHFHGDRLRKKLEFFFLKCYILAIFLANGGVPQTSRGPG